jgi:hypothetical protein
MREGYLSPHCASESCRWCRERRNRAHAQAVAEDLARQRVAGTLDERGPWERPLFAMAPRDIFGYWSGGAVAPRVPARVWTLKRDARTPGHRLIRRPHV